MPHIIRVPQTPKKYLWTREVIAGLTDYYQLCADVGSDVAYLFGRRATAPYFPLYSNTAGAGWVYEGAAPDGIEYTNIPCAIVWGGTLLYFADGGAIYRYNGGGSFTKEVDIGSGIFVQNGAFVFFTGSWAGNQGHRRNADTTWTEGVFSASVSGIRRGYPDPFDGECHSRANRFTGAGNTLTVVAATGDVPPTAQARQMGVADGKLWAGHATDPTLHYKANAADDWSLLTTPVLPASWDAYHVHGADGKLCVEFFRSGDSQLWTWDGTVWERELRLAGETFRNMISFSDRMYAITASAIYTRVFE